MNKKVLKQPTLPKTESELARIRDKVVSSTHVKKEPPVITMTDGVLIPKKGNKHLVTSWRLTFYGAVALLLCLCLFKPDTYWKIFVYTITGIPTTFECTIFAIMGAVVIGIITGVGSSSKNTMLKQICGIYVELIRGIPLLVQLMFLYYALGSLIHIEGIVAAIIALSICFGAYMGEIIRAGIQSIPKGQTEAARSLGFNRFQTMFYVILPQAWRTILPPVGNECIAMLKDTSLVSVMAMPDLMQRGRSFASKTYLYFETYTIVALVYLIITLLLSKCVAMMEARLNYYDRKK